MPLAPYLQRFFTERLGTQLKVSPNTIISYRDTFRLLFDMGQSNIRKRDCSADRDIDANLVGLFPLILRKRGATQLGVGTHVSRPSDPSSSTSRQ